MSVRRLVAVGCGLALLAPLAGPAAAAPAPVSPLVPAATGYLACSQQADGGFELAGFPGFETSDVVLAFAAAGQTGPAWDPARARAAVEGLESGGGRTPLDALDDLIDDEVEPGGVAAGARAAKVAAIVAAPLGIDPADFDPSADSAGAVDLFARMDLHRRPDGSYDFGAQFNGALYVAVALGVNGQVVPDGLVAQIRDAQRADGSWDYTGTPDEGDGEDIDTTALALVALRSAGLTVADADVRAAVRWLAARHRANGAWQAFDADDPNATSVAAIALSDLHVDLSTPAWRATYGAPATAVYVSPWAWLETQQLAGGRIASPNDGYGINTLPTSQTVQALARQWYLADEHRALTTALARHLGSPAANPNAAVAPAAAFALGPNASIASGRLAAAQAVLTSAQGRQAAAADLYRQALGRGIDASGEEYWSAKLTTITRPELLARLTGSAEFYARAGGNHPGFVDAVYRAVLGRGPDATGRAYWIARLDAGMPVMQVARSLSTSTEYRRKQVDAAYQRMLGRSADVSGRAYWTARLASTRVEVILALLGSSSEYYERVSAG